MKKVRLAADQKGLPEVFHDQAAYFMSIREPKAGDELTLRLRAARGCLREASLAYRYGGKTVKHPMKSIGSAFDKTGRYEFFEVTFKVPEKAFIYRFLITAADGRTYHYIQRCPDCLSVQPEVPYEKDDDIGSPEFTETPPHGWEVLPGFSTPDWAKGAVWYSVAPDAFYNGDPTNDDTHSDDNYDQPWNIAHNALDDRYGGDLQGIMDKAEHVKALGADGVFFNPINKSNQNMGYGTTDFGQIESSFGTADKYSEMISYMHANDLRLMQDVVISFTTLYGYYANRNDYWPKEGCFDPKTGKLTKGRRNYSMIVNADEGGRQEWGGFYINNCDRALKKLLYTEKNSALYRYADKDQGFGVDAYRFDCGGWITGHKGTLDKNEYTEGERKHGYHNPTVTSNIMHDIRKHIKKANPELDILSESSAAQLRAGAWDSQWNLGFNDCAHKYIKGEQNAEDMRTRMMLWNTWEKPRGTAECSNNQINTHDRNSCKKRPENAYRWRAARIMQMTAVGSPSIYYGEETNFSGCEFLGGNGSNSKGFSYFDWDESKWEYDVYYLIHALCALRREFPVLRCGAIAELKLDEKNYDYVRFDENSAVFTLITTSEKTVSRKVNAAVAGLADGTVLTDWLTGKHYTVTDGCVTADIACGGTVLVTGKKSSAYRVGMNIENIGRHTAEVLSSKDEKTVIITENGSALGGKKDNITFLCAPAFGCCSVAAEITADNGAEGAVMIRASLDADAPFYAASVKNGKLYIVSRAAKGKEAVRREAGDANGKLRIERLADNTLRVTLAGKAVKGTEMIVDLRDRVLAGCCVTAGSAEFRAAGIASSGGRPLCDKFDGNIPNAFLSETGSAKLSGGKLAVPAGTAVYTRTPDDDWSFVTELDYAPSAEGDLAGAISRQSDRHYVIAGRKFEDGQTKLFFAKTSAGKQVVLFSTVDPAPEKKLTVSLHRIGSHYSAAYSYGDGVWHPFGESVFYNLSSENAGVLVSGKTGAKLSYVGFGDAVTGGCSTFMPRGCTDFTVSKRIYGKHYKLRFVKGDLDYADEGLAVKSESYASAAVVNRKYTAFRAEASLSAENEKGYVGMAFGLPSPDSAADDGYSLRLTGGELVLAHGGSVLCRAKPKPSRSIRTVLEVTGGRAVVYAGADAEPLMNTELEANGYFAFCAEGTTAHINNFNICAADSEFYCSANIFSSERDSVKINGNGSCTLWARGKAYTDFTLKTVIEPSRFDPRQESSAGVLVCGSCGVAEKFGGIYIKLTDSGLTLTNKGKELLPTVPLQRTDRVLITAVKKGRTLSVFADGIKKPVAEYSLSADTGTAPAFVSENSLTRFSGISVTEMTDPEDMTDKFGTK